MLLEKQLIEKIIETALATGGDFAEVFSEETVSGAIQTVGGLVEKANSRKQYGVGIRIAHKLQSVYGYTNSQNPDDVIKLSSDLSKSFSDVNKSTPVKLGTIEVGKRHQVKISPLQVKQSEKVALLKKAYHAAKTYDEVIQQVMVGLSEWVQTVVIANSEGRYVTEVRTRIRLGINAIAGKDGVMQTGYEAPGTGKGYEYFYEDIDIEEIYSDIPNNIVHL